LSRKKNHKNLYNHFLN